MATRESGGYIPTGKITFDGVEVDNSMDFNAETGTFTAPSTGLYHFQFDAYVNGADLAEVYVYVNGNVYHKFYNNSASGRQIASFWTAHLNTDDQLYLSNEFPSSIYIHIGDHQMYFEGYLMN